MRDEVCVVHLYRTRATHCQKLGLAMRGDACALTQEPTFLISAPFVQSECHGVSVAGAGGGGLLVLLTKEPNIMDRVRGLVGGVGNGRAVVHKAEIFSGDIFI